MELMIEKTTAGSPGSYPRRSAESSLSCCPWRVPFHHRNRPLVDGGVLRGIQRRLTTVVIS